MTTQQIALPRAGLAPALTPLMTFDQASEQVLDYLEVLLPLGFWSVSAYDADGDRQVHLFVRDQADQTTPGDAIPWSESFCQYMVTGAAPQIAPDAMAVPQYAAVASAQHLDIGAYVGVPIRGADGELFGTLCGTAPVVQSAGLLEQHGPLLELLATLLGQILARERLQTEAEEREATLRWRAFHDELTGLANRALFNDRLDHALALHRRDQRPLGVLTLDIDDFKAINDTFGHGGGDELLSRLAERLRGAVRAGDTLARLGGDEFAVLVEDGEPEAGVRPSTVVAERIIAVMAEPFLITGRSVLVGVSVGSAELDPGPGPVAAATLLNHADVALYSSKRSGKARLTVYEPAMQLPEARDLQLREPLRRAIADGGLSAVYQPVIALGSGSIAGLECLARWSHEGQPVPPDVFVPLAIRSHLVLALTDVMLDHACAQLDAWNRLLGHDRLSVAVNVPPGLLSDPGFPARVAEHVERHQLQPRQLALEITEHALLDDTGAALAVCEDLCAQGFLLSLDDFGTGYSSLLHLRAIPLESVKIDRGFTHDVDTNPTTQRFIRAVLAMGRDLGLRVIVEGVERTSQAEMLVELGATHAQGYLFARPVPADQVDLAGRAIC